MKKSDLVALAGVSLMAFTGQAWAADAGPAQVSSASGSVVVTPAGQTAPLSSASILHAGDRLIAMDGGQARVKFADGCVMRVEAHSMATIGAQSPCAASGLVKGSNPMDLGDADPWIAPLAIIGFVGAFAAVVATEKSDHSTPTITPLSP
jgi:hypothetical protein